MPSQPHHTPQRDVPSAVNRTTEDATPSLSGAIRKMTAGHSLDEMVGRTVLALTKPTKAHGVSLSWDGARRVVERLTTLGCYVQVQVHKGQCFCQVLRVLEGAAVAKQLASVDAPQMPEAVAKAALIACLEMLPPS